jgi:hypothetical protein
MTAATSTGVGAAGADFAVGLDPGGLAEGAGAALAAAPAGGPAGAELAAAPGLAPAGGGDAERAEAAPPKIDDMMFPNTDILVRSDCW